MELQELKTFQNSQNKTEAIRKLTRFFHEVCYWIPLDYQKQILYDFLTEDKIVAVLCRQTGKSTTTAHYVVYEALRSKNKTILIFAPTDKQTGELFNKLYNIIMRIPISKFLIKRSTQREIEFITGVRIIAQTVGDKGENIRGFTGDIIILEEAGSIKDSIIQEVILPMGATAKFRTGKDVKIIKIGTPRGMNHFYKSYAEGDYIIHQYDYRYAVRAKLHTAEFYEQRRKDTQDIEFQTEYCAQFIPDQDAYFSYDLIDYCIGEPEIEDRAAEGYDYFLGVDPSRQGSDDCVFIVLKKGKNRENSRVVKIVIKDKILINQILGQIIHLDHLFHFKKIYIDETGLGSGVSDFAVEQFGEENVPEQYRRVQGITFTQKNKQELYANLHRIMGTRGGKGLKIPNHRKLVEQLKDFRYEVSDGTGNLKLHHSEYGHDDLTDGLALAAFGLLDETPQIDPFIIRQPVQQASSDYESLFEI